MTDDDYSASGQIVIYEDGSQRLQVRLDGNTVWLTQAQIAELYGTTPQNITIHISAVYDDKELSLASTCKDYLQVRSEGGRNVERTLKHYSLDIILAIGYRVRSSQGTRFRQWATSRLSELLVKGFTLDDERIKAGRSIGQDYFDELLERIRDIRASERRFYQKITDIFSLSVDYDGNSSLARSFFQTVQNKLHFAAHGQTAAEVIRTRADANRTNMGLTNWKNAPSGPVRKPDIGIAKNYLSKDELSNLNLLVSSFLDIAELQARNRKPMQMVDWIGRLDGFLQFTDHGILTTAGTVSHEAALASANQEFDLYDTLRLAAAAEAPGEFDHLTEAVNHLAKSTAKTARPKPRRS
ncbi:MAG: virulence RhuM family protein [Acidobacteriota bacterium]